MSNQELPITDFLDIDEDTVNAGEALLNGSGGLLTPPTDARTSTDSKSGAVYERWSEGALIEAVWRETTKKEKIEERLLTVVVQVKIRAGFTNQHERTWIRLMLSPQIMAKQAPFKEGHTKMHERSIGAISSLLGATGFKPKGGLTGALLNHLFPMGKGNKNSQLVGREITVNFVNSPNTGASAKNMRQTNAESFLPYAPPVVTE